MESNDLFDSSDSVRSGKALAHVKTAVFPGPIKLSTGRFLPELPLVIAFLILVLIAVPIRFYLYQFLFSRIFFKGKLNGRKTN